MLYFLSESKCCCGSGNYLHIAKSNFCNITQLVDNYISMLKPGGQSSERGAPLPVTGGILHNIGTWESRTGKTNSNVGSLAHIKSIDRKPSPFNNINNIRNRPPKWIPTLLSKPMTPRINI